MSLDISSAAPKLVLITSKSRGHFDEETGFTEGNQPMSFLTNVGKKRFLAYIKVISENEFPAEAFGVGEDAEGYNEETGESFPVPDCYALYAGSCSNEDVIRLYELIDKELYDPAFRKNQPWVVRPQYQG